MGSSEVGRYQMLWDCPACGTAGLLGLDHRHCPSCGAAQDPARRYFPDEAHRIAVEDHPFHGADRLCPACESPNAAKAGHCVNCGSPLDEAKAVARRADQAAGVTDDVGKAAAEAKARREAARAQAQAQAAESSGVAPPAGASGAGRAAGFGLFAVLGCLGLAVAAVVGFFLLNSMWAEEGVFQVTGRTWERSVDVEELRAVAEEAWRDQVPAGARGTLCHREQRSTKQVADGQTCADKKVDKGDGTFSVVRDCQPKYRSEPVYDERCSYTVDRWVKVEAPRAEGTGSAPPTWPTVAGLGPTRREGARHERYGVKLTGPDGKAHDCSFPEARWTGMKEGSAWAGTTGGLTGALDCDGLTAK